MSHLGTNITSGHHSLQHPAKGQPTQGRADRSSLSQRNERQEKYSEPGTAQPGKEKLMTAQDRNTGDSFKSCPYHTQQNGLFKSFLAHKPCSVQRCFIKVSEQFLNPAPSLPAALCTARQGRMLQQDTALNPQPEAPAAANSSACTALKIKRFLFSMQGPFEIQKHYSSSFGFVSFPPPSHV